MQQNLITNGFQYRQQDPDYKGYPLDERYGDGTIESRKITDLFCYFIFILYLAGLIYVAFLAFHQGDPYLLTSPYDADGNLCGVDVGYEDHPKIFVTQNQLGSKTTFLCVKKCPKSSSQVLDCKTTKDISDCSSIISYECQTTVNYCFPLDESISFFQEAKDLLSQNWVTKNVTDLFTNWSLILIAFAFAFATSVIFSLFVLYLPDFMVWFMLIVFIVLQILIALVTLLLPYIRFLNDFMEYDALPAPLRDRTFHIVLSALSFILFLVSLTIAIFKRQQINITIGMIQAASTFFKSQCSSYFLNFLKTILYGGFFTFWFFCVIYLYSSHHSKQGDYPSAPFRWVQFNDGSRILVIFQIIALFWMINILLGIQHFWIAHTVSDWYFSRGKPVYGITKSICRSFYHIGSIGLGCLVLIVIQIFKWVLKLVYDNYKQDTLKLVYGKPVSFLMKCASCYIACFERSFRFLIEGFYIIMAISGKNFCESARQSFYLTLRTERQFTIKTEVSKIFILFSSGVIMTICGIIGYLFMTNFEPYKHQVQSPVLLTVVYVLVAFPISYSFMEYFEVSTNTLLACYCIEIDLKKKRPKCPQAVRKFLQNHTNSSSVAKS